MLRTFIHHIIADSVVASMHNEPPIINTCLQDNPDQFNQRDDEGAESNGAEMVAVYPFHGSQNRPSQLILIPAQFGKRKKRK